MHVSKKIELNNIIMINLNENYSSHTWNEDDEYFDQQLKK